MAIHASNTHVPIADEVHRQLTDAVDLMVDCDPLRLRDALIDVLDKTFEMRTDADGDESPAGQIFWLSITNWVARALGEKL